MEGKKRLTRTRESDAMLFGVCGGVAKFFDLDSTIVRVAWAIATVVGLGSPILLYGIMAVIVPKEA
ncbi:PspC domain-containing protein [Marinilongibacter aquaticus]|uniref:PspC domain-containing protein n=1 Tax=Marinilongibacter aquaticus TaxID=2975157 RepID=UPI0021BD928A|nr:PspC domain-containing protein [Marinilongibacter aquaticus]UBM60366.1 PspC domain-containing protein [Marinilongibacter aquaticus]